MAMQALGEVDVDHELRVRARTDDERSLHVQPLCERKPPPVAPCSITLRHSNEYLPKTVGSRVTNPRDNHD